MMFTLLFAAVRKVVPSPPSFWERHQDELIVGVVYSVAAGLILLLLTFIGKRICEWCRNRDARKASTRPESQTAEVQPAPADVVRAAPGPPQPVITQPAAGATERVNVEPTGEYNTDVHLDGYTRRLVQGFGDIHNRHFLGGIAEFRNSYAAGHTVVDAYDVKAEIEVSNADAEEGTTDRVGGYFLGTSETEWNGIHIEAGGQGRALLIAVRDEQGTVYIVERRTTGDPGLMRTYDPRMGARRFGITVRLGIDGRLILTTKYELAITPGTFTVTRR